MREMTDSHALKAIISDLARQLAEKAVELADARASVGRLTAELDYVREQAGHAAGEN